MKTLSATYVARNFSAVLDAVERDHEEIVLVRNQRQVARLMPEAPRQDACGFRKFWPLDSGNSGAFPGDAGRLS
jgi:antitoxin (DNA-binding transcriptional repressor) of toxin-antitoxin stability system